MRVVKVFNRHRGGGGSDNATDATVSLVRERGIELELLEYDSNDLAPGLRGQLSAFASALYAREPARRLAALIERFRPDVVHVYELYPMISPWVLPVCSRLGVPVVMTCYDYRLSCPVATHFEGGRICTRCVGGREHHAVLRNCRGSLHESLAYALRSAVANHLGLVRRHVAHFVTPTDFTANWLAEHAGMPRERITSIPCLVPMPERPVADPSQGSYVGFAARFVVEKGFDVLAEAVREAALPLVVALPKPADYTLRPEDRIRILVTRGREELDAFYRGCRVFVMPSVWFESFGLAAAEAMSHGVPVISSDIGALAEVSRDGETGFLVPPGDPEQLAARLRTLWDDPDRCRSMGLAARAHIKELTRPDHHFEALLGVYRRVVAT